MRAWLRAGMRLQTELGAATDPEGNPLPDDYNPLGGKRGIFHPLEEIYFAGFEHSAKTQSLIDDLQAGLADDSWAASQYKNCIGADVDGDGFYEVVVVYYASGTLRLKVIDNDNGTYSEHNKVVVSGIESLPQFPEYQPGLAKGDLDKDGKDEIVMFAVITVPSEVNKIFECLKRNNAPSFDKVETKAS